MTSERLRLRTGRKRTWCLPTSPAARCRRLVPRARSARGASAGGAGAAAVAALGARIGGIRGVHGQFHAGRVDHRQTHHQHQRPAHPHRVVRPGADDSRAPDRGVGRLAGLAHPDRPQPHRGARCPWRSGRRRHSRRPEPAGCRQPRLRGHRDRRRIGADRMRRRGPSLAGDCGPRWRTVASIGALFMRALPWCC